MPAEPPWVHPHRALVALTRQGGRRWLTIPPIGRLSRVRMMLARCAGAAVNPLAVLACRISASSKLGYTCG